MKKTALNCWVGFFVVLGFVALLFLALKAGNMSSLSFKPTYSVNLKFDNIGGLKPHAPVKSAGVTVGRVVHIDFDNEDYQALVTLSIDRPYQFPKDTFAKILTTGVLGEQYIGLDPGGDDEMLKNGDTITMTQSAVLLENLISQFLYNKAADAGGAKQATAPAANAESTEKNTQEKLNDGAPDSKVKSNDADQKHDSAIEANKPSLNSKKKEEGVK